MKKTVFFCVIASLMLMVIISYADVKPNSLFSDHMVFQRDVAVPVWGHAEEGEKVTIDFNGQKLTTKTVDGKWLFELKPLKSGGPYTMEIAGRNKIVISDIMVGEVWLCSGQSNMSWEVIPPVYQWKTEQDNADYPRIREYRLPFKKSLFPLEDGGGHWDVCTPVAIHKITAVGYFFARALYRKLNVPIGIILSSVSGSLAESWVSRAALDSIPNLSSLAQAYDKAVVDYRIKLNTYRTNESVLLEKYGRDSIMANQKDLRLPTKPLIQDPLGGNYACELYYGMIAPLIPYPFKGVAWYQGESNSKEPAYYKNLLSALIVNWRNSFNSGNFPYLIVQVAPFKDTRPEIREAQLLVSQNIKNCALIVTTDVGDSLNIHPPHKQVIGERLSLAARAIAYQEKITYSGPIYQSMKIDHDTIILFFSYTGKGLIAKNGNLAGFVIAGSNKQFISAKAEIKGNTVIVHGDGIADPIAVRYGWTNTPTVNLFNEDGLPASPFRTDMEK